MPTTILENHLQLLRRQNPDLAQRVDRLADSVMYELVPSRQGAPTLLCPSLGPGGISLHSRYDPVTEAQRLVQTISLKASSHYLVLGLGLGYHVLELIQRVPAHSQILVVEADPNLFRLALQQPALAPLLKYPGLKFWVGLPPEDIPAEFEPYKIGFTLNGFNPVRFQPVIGLHPDYYAEVEQTIARQIRETQVNQNTQSALSRAFYQNCLANVPAIQTAPGIDTLQNGYGGVPAIVVSAGPSLDKNLNLLQGVGSRALIIAVATALKPLLSAGIAPDFVVAIDPNQISISAFDADPLPESTHLVFHPCIPPEIVDRFPGRRVVTGGELMLWQFLSRGLGEKGSLGKSYSVAHTALKFARHLGCRPVVLVGQDLAFAGPRSHCSGSHQNDQHQRSIGTVQTARLIDHSRHRASAPALQRAQDVFGNTIVTSQALDTFRKLFSEEIQDESPVFNATEGGLPIPGALNMTLREALNRLPDRNQSSQAIQQDNAGEAPSLQRLAEVLMQQARRFETHAQRIEDWLDRRGAPSTRPETYPEQEAETVLSPLLSDHVSVSLLQEFIYADFLEWNRTTYRIGLLNPEHEKTQIHLQKCERDRWFFPKLVKAAWWLETEFTRLAAALTRPPISA